MKVLVLSNRVPFVHGGAEELSLNLVKRLRLAGHDADAVRIPFSWTPSERLFDEILIARHLRITNADRVIALKFPAYLVEHSCKVVWLLHQYRQAYDLFDANKSNIGHDAAGDALRRAIQIQDRRSLEGAHRLFALPEAHRRLRRYNGLDSELMATPLNDPELFVGSSDDSGYIFAGGRISPGKRQSLLIEALVHAPSVHLVVAGPVEDHDYGQQLMRLASDCGVSDRVEFYLGFHSRERIAQFVNQSVASAYVPFEEDNYGYVTLEAFSASKPVVTTNDSGAVLDVVLDGQTGLVVEAAPEAIGCAMERIAKDRSRAREMGRAANELLEGLRLSWPDVLKRLLS